MDVKELFHIGIYHGYIIQLLAAEMIYTATLHQRDHFGLRLGFGVLIYGLSSVIIINLGNRYIPGMSSFSVFLASLLLGVWCFRNPFREILFCCVAAQLTQNLAHDIENLIYQPFQDVFSGVRWPILSVVVMILVYAVCYRVFAKRLERQKQEKVNGIYIYVLSIASALFVYSMQYLFQRYQIDRLWIAWPPLILCCAFGLCVQFGLLALTSEREERKVLERLIESERRQHELREESIDIINRKAHDLKHQISRFRTAGGIDDPELAEIESAVEQYEITFETGCRTLDVLLAEKQLQCRKDQIQMSAMVQGEVLSFLKAGEIASLFGNALDNAIECERSIPEPTKRYVALNVFERKNLVCIRVENYCPMERVLVRGLPVTTKEDHGIHGFGMKSMQYIAQKYGGTLHIDTDDDLFVLCILLPIPEVVES